VPAGDLSRFWVDRSGLRDVQYRTQANLAARQSIYAYQQPPLYLPALVLGLAALSGGETVADVGCGNGLYLAELARMGQAGAVLGVDFSLGMLAAARARAPGARLLAGDAVSLPLRDGVGDLALAMHMLYHVPDPQAAVRELRRITRPGGQVIIGLNADDHMHELRTLVADALAENSGGAGPVVREQLSLDSGAALLAPFFASVTRHDFVSELLLPGPQPVEDYVRSMIVTQHLPDAHRIVAAVIGRLPRGVFRVRTHSGCLICT
jgi:SAM-dependent methyltransferase